MKHFLTQAEVPIIGVFALTKMICTISNVLPWSIELMIHGITGYEKQNLSLILIGREVMFLSTSFDIKEFLEIQHDFKLKNIGIISE